MTSTLAAAPVAAAPPAAAPLGAALLAAAPLAAAQLAATPIAATSGVAPVIVPAPIATATAPGARPVLRRIDYEPPPGGSTATDLRPVAPAPPLLLPPPPRPVQHPGAHATITRLLRVACEVLDGRRPEAHLAGHAEPSVLRYWRVATQQRTVRTPARFSRIRLCHPRVGAAEVAVTVELDGRARALAARFELRDERWRCTVLRLG